MQQLTWTIHQVYKPEHQSVVIITHSPTVNPILSLVPNDKVAKMNAILCLVVCFSALVAAAPTDYDMGYDHAMTYAQPMTYAAPSYAAPSYDVHDVVSSIDSCEVNSEPI